MSVVNDPRIRVVYFSSVTNNSVHFVDKLGFPADRIPLYRTEEPLVVDEPYVLVTPTYGDGDGRKIVPMQVKKFLSVESNRNNCLGVVAGGNTNFGNVFGIAGCIVSEKVRVPHLYSFELFGTVSDVENVLNGLNENWGALLEMREKNLSSVLDSVDIDGNPTLWIGDSFNERIFNFDDHRCWYSNSGVNS